MCKYLHIYCICNVLLCCCTRLIYLFKANNYNAIMLSRHWSLLQACWELTNTHTSTYTGTNIYTYNIYTLYTYLIYKCIASALGWHWREFSLDYWRLRRKRCANGYRDCSRLCADGGQGPFEVLTQARLIYLPFIWAAAGLYLLVEQPSWQCGVKCSLRAICKLENVANRNG